MQQGLSLVGNITKKETTRHFVCLEGRTPPPYEDPLPKHQAKASRSNSTFQEIQGMRNMTNSTMASNWQALQGNNPFPQQINCKLKKKREWEEGEKNL